MAILKLNPANPGVKRPLKVQDLADLWHGLNTALAQGTETSPRILCGFNVSDDGDSFTSGVIAYNGRLYLYDDGDPIFFDDSIYGAEISTDDNRVMEDGTTQLFSYACIVTKNSTLPGAVFIGEASPSNIEAWRGPLSIPDLYITRNMIVENAISTSKLADSAVTARKMAYMLRPCILSSTPYEFSPSPTSPPFKLSNLMISPSTSGQSVWETMILKIVDVTISDFMLTVVLYNFSSDYADMPANIPVMISHTNPSVPIMVRFSYPDPILGGVRFTVPYTLQDGKGMQVMLAKCPPRLCYLPVSVIQEA